MKHYIQADSTAAIQMKVTPESAGWRYLDFQILSLEAGETFTHETEGREVALTSLTGRAHVTVGDETFTLARENVFAEMAQVLYVPPRQRITITVNTAFECALGGAPAEGKYPVRLFVPEEMKQELRGGGAARRQVNHLLAYPLPAERLILYDAYVPAGMWAGMPPHCHDGYMNSPYLEEVYYYRLDPADGFAIHRNYRCDSDFDELFTVRNGDAVLVAEGFHPVAVPPGTNVYFLNYLAGDLVDEARKTPPYNDPAYAWMAENWTGNALELPVVQNRK